ncbi:MAG: diguanylate cyclase [Oscillospiraceae bacterium]|nr:diguanylate cyclase [Oscillospiraceae bacterium]
MKNILIVDDNKINLASARKVLSGEYKVIPVMRGEQALTYLENGECDIILLDINMPEMDGFEVLDRIKQMERCKHIPVIFLTADNDSETETRCFKEGAVDFIAKPFVTEVMLSRISRVLELEELRRSLADRLEQKTKEVSDIKSKSRQDALTGLWNRAHTEETVNAMISEGVRGALMMIDMDNFKAINDNYGHIAGDQTLKMFADTLRKFSEEGDILCRIGGDEFVVFAKDLSSKSEIGNRASDIISDLCYNLEQCKFETNSSVSIGIAQTPDDGTEFNKLYNAADKALYYVKQNGKNSYHFFSDQNESEKKRASKSVDLAYLSELLSRADSGKGAYLLDFDSFHHVYNFIKRFVSRSGREVQTILFTVIPADGVSEPAPEEVEAALEMLDKAIYTSLRRVDVSTRYSSKQIIVILMDANTENGDLVAKRIISCFEKLYIGGQLKIEYGIAKMEGNNILGKNPDSASL